MRTTVRELKAAHKRNMDTLTEDFLKERAKKDEKIAELTKENAKITFETTEGFSKLVATIGERDAQIRALTLQATIMASEAEANMAKFIEVENSRDVQAHLAGQNQKEADDREKENEALRFEFQELYDERATLLAALKRIVREGED
jgi:phage I-like protein